MDKDLKEAHFKQVTDEANMLADAREEGKFKERQFAVRKLVEVGWPLERIQEVLGIDPQKYL